MERTTITLDYLEAVQLIAAAEVRVLGIAGGDDPERWRTAIRGLAVHSVAGLGGARLSCRAPDAPLIADLDAVAAGSLERLGEDAAPGVRAWSAD